MIAITNNAPHVRTFSLDVAGGLLLAVIEANLNNPRAYAGDLLDDFLNRAMAPVGSITSNIVEHVAESVSSTLLADAAFRTTITGVIFAGIFVTPMRVHFCTAGDMRVHVMDEHGAVLCVTRDHNAISDPQPHLDAISQRYPPGFFESVLTRMLPLREDGQGPPECFDEEFRPGWSVLVCSSRVHSYRQPAAYLRSLRASGDSVAGVPDLGFAAVIMLPGEERLRRRPGP